MKNQQESSKQEYSFITEKIKERPKSRKRIAMELGCFVAAAIAFGMIASIVMAWMVPELLKVWEEDKAPEMVTIPKDDADTDTVPTIAPEVTAEVTQEPVVNVVEKTLESKDYISLYSQIYQVADSVKNSLVTVVSVSSNVDWLNNPYENEGQASGIVVADNGKEYLILTDKSVVENAKEIRVTFGNGKEVSAVQKKQDGNTGLAILAVEHQGMTAEERSQIQLITLGNSKLLHLGTPILAVGSPLGTTDSVLSGNITSLKTFSDTEDVRYPLVKTDMLGSNSGNGVLLNLDGQVVGIFTRELSALSENGTVLAYGISELKGIIERLSNNLGIAYLGVKCREVTKEDEEAYGMPKGVGVINVTTDSPAMNAGIQNGDIIVEMEGKEIKTLRDFENIIGTCEPEQLLTITVMRSGTEGYVEVRFDVTLGVMQ